MARAMESVILAALALSLTAGCSGPNSRQMLAQDLYASQRYARQLVSAKSALTSQYSARMGELEQTQVMAQALESEKQSLVQHVASLEGNLQTAQGNMLAAQSDLQVANQRVENLLAERQQLQQRYATLIDEDSGVISDSVAGRFQDLANRYPDIEFDPNTGMSRFNGEILFDSGSSKLKPGSDQMLRDFASVLNDAEARELKVLVVGHTDDRRIARDTTHAQHKTNWHLSTNRANAVVLALRKLGIGEARLGAMGYSKFQPVTDNYDDNARQMNRRVEIYVLAPDALIAAWDPRTSRN